MKKAARNRNYRKKRAPDMEEREAKTDTFKRPIPEDVDLSCFSEIVNCLPDVTFPEILKSNALYKLSLICACRGSHKEYFRKCALFALHRQFKIHHQLETFLESNFQKELFGALEKGDYFTVHRMLVRSAEGNALKRTTWVAILPALILFEYPKKLLVDFIECRLRFDGPILDGFPVFVNNYDNHLLTPLIYAILVGDVDSVKGLLESGANVDKADNLWDVKDSRYVSDANTNIFIGGNKTPLMYAICVESLGCLQILLKYKANLRLKCFRKMNAVCYAIELNNLSFLEILLKAPVEIHRNQMMSINTIEPAVVVSPEKSVVSKVVSDVKKLSIDDSEFMSLKRRFNELVHPEGSMSEHDEDDGSEVSDGENKDLGQTCGTETDITASETCDNEDDMKGNGNDVLFDGLLSSEINSSFTFSGNDVTKFSFDTENSQSSEPKQFVFGDLNVTSDYDGAGGELNSGLISGQYNSGNGDLSVEKSEKSMTETQILTSEKNNFFNFGSSNSMSSADNHFRFSFKPSSDSESKSHLIENGNALPVSTDGKFNIDENCEAASNFTNTGNEVNGISTPLFNFNCNSSNSIPIALDKPQSFNQGAKSFDFTLPAQNNRGRPENPFSFESDNKQGRRQIPLVKNQTRIGKKLLDRKKNVGSSCPVVHETSWKTYLNSLNVQDLYLNNMKVAAEESLPVAVEKGDPDYIRLVLQQCGDINYTLESTGYSALMIASKMGNVHLVEILLKSWPNIELKAKTDECETALMLACKNGHVDCANILIQFNASVHTINKYQETALIYALRSKNLECVKLLLENEASIEIKSIRLQEPGFPLMIASVNGDVDCVKILLENNAAVDEVNNNHESSLMFAVKHGNFECVKLLLDHKASINARSQIYPGETVLQTAIKNGQKDCVPLLLEHGAKIEITDDEDCDALSCAARINDVHCVELLINHLRNNCDSSTSNNEADHQEEKDVQMKKLASLSDHALPYTIMADAENACFDLILPYCEHCNGILKCSNMTALMIASKFGKDRHINNLLDKGADVNYECEGLTALICATQNRQLGCLKNLLKHGADPTTGSYLQQKAIHFALQNDDPDCFDCLLKTGIDVNSFSGKQSLMVVALSNYAEKCISILIGTGCKVNLSDLCCNCRHLFGSPKKLERLLESKVVLLDGKTDGNYIEVDNELPDMPCGDEIIESMENLMKHRVFDWRFWNVDSIELSALLPKALTVGIAPGSMILDSMYVSPLKYALLINHECITSYLFSNLYFTLDDYRFLTSDKNIKEQLQNRFDSERNKLFHHVCVNPWNLQTVCLLTISTAMFNNGRKDSRFEQVQTLPIPERFKTILSFRHLTEYDPADGIDVMDMPHWLLAGYSLE